MRLRCSCSPPNGGEFASFAHILPAFIGNHKPGRSKRQRCLDHCGNISTSLLTQQSPKSVRDQTLAEPIRSHLMSVVVALCQTMGPRSVANKHKISRRQMNNIMRPRCNERSNSVRISFVAVCRQVNSITSSKQLRDNSLE